MIIKHPNRLNRSHVNHSEHTANKYGNSNNNKEYNTTAKTFINEIGLK